MICNVPLDLLQLNVNLVQWRTITIMVSNYLSSINSIWVATLKGIMTLFLPNSRFQSNIHWRWPQRELGWFQKQLGKSQWHLGYYYTSLNVMNFRQNYIMMERDVQKAFSYIPEQFRGLKSSHSSQQNHVSLKYPRLESKHYYKLLWWPRKFVDK